MHASLIQTHDALALRAQQLRPTLTPEECIFDYDSDPAAFHVGVWADDKVVSIGSFYPCDCDKPLPIASPVMYRLRAMATDQDYKKRGCGSLVIKYAIEELHNRKADVLWCNARLKAFEFYKKNEFQIHGETFDISPIGLHYLMYRELH